MASKGLNKEFNCLHYSLTKSASVTIRTLSKGMLNRPEFPGGPLG